MKSLRVILADSHLMFREGLRSIILSRPENGIQIVGEAAEGLKALSLVQKEHPDLLLTEAALPELNGIELVRKVKALKCGARVIILSSRTSDRLVKQSFAFGASGYILKEQTYQQLLFAILQVMKGHCYLDPKISRTILRDFLGKTLDPRQSNAYTELTDREREVLKMTSEGISTKEAAGALSVSAKTIETHRRNIMEKLNLHSIAELTKYAIREGLTSLD
jgi:DNA-binding NarL/FixJ family response regulator